ncbi:PREDICTED: prominin-1-A-like [Thamnophis sirtalis]|uniref:Prominin-1-A-like n=1 Tax=Thamnophis sirtalis TaxID=35019 RepID=A0A6I9XY89_9SAUR|nr:PREDICTED: prominin-1-A-like [Thamnophis sirtalis]XP_013909434.1 PREDICTED: prominin-1-A-like [Thamnophis sirtalis]XP_013909435.1 PREDICTED: prominin-1-A-like [Thamnophis sirtalis]
MPLQNLTQPVYHQPPSNSHGDLQGLFNMVNGYLRVVQPNSFPKDLLTYVINHQNFFNNQTVYKEILKYETGFLVCAVIGLLFIVLVPLVGLFFCCCRCCGHCGGQMYQKQNKHSACKRRTLFCFLLGITVVLLAGDICAYVSNQRISQGLEKGFVIFNNTVSNLDVYLNSLPQEINQIVKSSNVPFEEVNNSLSKIGDTLGSKIKEKLGERANKVLNITEELLQDIQSIDRELQKVNQTGARLQKMQEELNKNLTDLRNDINETLKTCGSRCEKVSVENLTPEANFSTIPDVNDKLNLISELNPSELNNTIIKARNVINEIPEKVSNQTKNEASEIQDLLNEVRKGINTISDKFHKMISLKEISAFMENIVKKANYYKPHVIKYDGYRWGVGVCLCCLLLVIIAFNVLGLLLGGLGLDSKGMQCPTNRGCLSNTGGNFFMASVGFSFIFSWLLMLLVLVLFLVGGNSYTLVCQPWANGIILQYLDTSGLIPQLNVKKLMNLNGSDVNLTSIYKNCEGNASLWNTFHLDEVISLNDTFNISKYTQDINSTLNKIEINIEPIELLNDEQKSRLRKLSSKDGPLNVDFNSTLEQLNQNLTKQDLNTLINNLEELANITDDGIRNDLRRHANELKNIQNWTNLKFLPEIEALKGSIQRLQKSTPQIPILINLTLSEIDDTNVFIKDQTEKIINYETNTFILNIVDYFSSYLTWIARSIIGEFGRCGPVAWALDSVNTVVCNYLVDSLNAFWFSLAWCTVFLLPSIIFAVRLAKFYRRMSVEDIYEDEIMENFELSRQSMFKMPRPQLKK